MDPRSGGSEGVSEGVWDSSTSVYARARALRIGGERFEGRDSPYLGGIWTPHITPCRPPIEPESPLGGSQYLPICTPKDPILEVTPTGDPWGDDVMVCIKVHTYIQKYPKRGEIHT